MVNLKNLKYGFSIKQIYNYYLYKKSNKKDTILNYRPIWLLIYVSDLCNLRCEMCPHHSGKNNDFEYQKQLSKKFISLDMIEKIGQELKITIKVLLRLTSNNQFGLSKNEVIKILENRYSYQ